jgi:signal transduction histidine kinase
VLDPVSKTLLNTMNQVRFLSHSLHNDFINDGGLVRAIGQEAERLRGLGTMDVSFVKDGEEPELSRDARTVAFRLFQEAMNNALKHSGASRLQITLNGAKGFFLQLHDNGKGFDKLLMDQNSSGMGLKNMPRRAALAGLECNIDSRPGQGCTFNLISSTLRTA